MNKETLMSAMRDAAGQEFSAVPAEGDIAWDFSPSFLRRMDALVLRQQRAVPHGLSTARRIALIAALTALLILSLLSVSAFREPVFRFFTEFFEDHLDLSFGVEKPNDVQPPRDTFVLYTFTYIPEGFEQTVCEIVDDAFAHTEWHNKDGEMLILDQLPITGSPSIDTEESEITILNLDGMEFLIYKSEYTLIAYWTHDQYAFEFAAYANIPFESFVDVLESLAE